jgi:hypothetical protein
MGFRSVGDSRKLFLPINKIKSHLTVAFYLRLLVNLC